MEGSPIPQTDVVEGCLVASKVDPGILMSGVFLFGHTVVEREGLACGLDMAFEVRTFQRQLIRLDVQAAH